MKLALEWRQVDLRAGVMRIDKTKNNEPRTVPYAALAVLKELIDRQRDAGLIEPYVGFRPPFCGFPPAHSATMGYIFGVVAQLAEPPA